MTTTRTITAADSYWRVDSAILTSSPLRVGNLDETEDYDAALRFDALPAWVDLNSATLRINVTSDDGVAFRLYGHKVVAPTRLANGGLFASATKTTAYVEVEASTATGTRSIDVTAIVDELVAQSGWLAPGKLQFLMIADDRDDKICAFTGSTAAIVLNYDPIPYVVKLSTSSQTVSTALSISKSTFGEIEVGDRVYVWASQFTGTVLNGFERLGGDGDLQLFRRVMTASEPVTYLSSMIAFSVGTPKVVIAVVRGVTEETYSSVIATAGVAADDDYEFVVGYPGDVLTESLAIAYFHAAVDGYDLADAISTGWEPDWNDLYSSEDEIAIQVASTAGTQEPGLFTATSAPNDDYPEPDNLPVLESNVTDSFETVNKPSGTASGDTLILVSYGSGLTPPSGFTEIAEGTGYQAWFKTAGSSEPADYTVSSASALKIFRISGVGVIGTPSVDVSAASYDAGLGNDAFSWPNVTAGTNELLIWVHVYNSGSGTMYSISHATGAQPAKIVDDGDIGSLVRMAIPVPGVISGVDTPAFARSMIVVSSYVTPPGVLDGGVETVTDVTSEVVEQIELDGAVASVADVSGDVESRDLQANELRQVVGHFGGRVTGPVIATGTMVEVVEDWLGDL